MSLASADLPIRSGSAARLCPGLPERIGDGDRGAAGGKAGRSAAHPGDREAQIPDRQAAADAVRPLLGAADPAASSNSNCGSRSWKPAKPKRSAKAAAEDRPLPIREADRPKRKPLPDHLPRQEIVHEPEHDGAAPVPACGGDMARLGEDVTEVLDYVPGRFRVIRHVRPKYACRRCDAITQAPAPSLPTPRGRAAPGMLAHLLVSKYLDHLPLYRQSEIYARDGLDLDRSTLSDWVGQAVWLLQPIVEGIRRHVFAAEKIHGDDTPVPVLEPGLGRTRTGRLWVYVRDDRPFCGPAPPAAAYFYSPDRGGEHPAQHLADFAGFLQADAYAGFEALYDRSGAALPGKAAITEVACWAHCRRKIFEVWETTKSTGRQGGARPDRADLRHRGQGPLRSARRAAGASGRHDPAARCVLRLGQTTERKLSARSGLGRGAALHN